jgi:hypothetical protein
LKYLFLTGYSMATDPPALDPPTTRSRLVEAFGPIESWGEHSPAAMQAILDALDAETVPAVDSLDDLENIEGSDLPYVIKGNNQSPGELPDQAIPTGKQLKTLSSSVSDQVESVSDEVQSVNAQTLNSVGTMADISDPEAGDRYFVVEIDTTVERINSGQYRINGKAVVDTKSDLPNSNLFVAGSTIEVLDTGKIMEVEK